MDYEYVICRLRHCTQISLAQFLERYLDVLQLHRHLDNDTYVTYVYTPYVPSFSGRGNILDAHHPT